MSNKLHVKLYFFTYGSCPRSRSRHILASFTSLISGNECLEQYKLFMFQFDQQSKQLTARIAEARWERSRVFSRPRPITSECSPTTHARLTHATNVDTLLCCNRTITN